MERVYKAQGQLLNQFHVQNVYLHGGFLDMSLHT
jgi:hypothetical protein